MLTNDDLLSRIKTATGNNNLSLSSLSGWSNSYLYMFGFMSCVSKGTRRNAQAIESEIKSAFNITSLPFNVGNFSLVWDSNTSKLLSESSKIYTQFIGDSTPTNISDTPSNSATQYAIQDGFDLVLCVGQSNSEGWGTPYNHLLDYTDDKIFQMPGAGQLEKKICRAIDPLIHRRTDPVNNSIGFHMQFAREYVYKFDRRILLLPCASPGTGFADNRWNPGNDLFEYAVNQVIFAKSLNAKNELKCILWHQGEQDVNNSLFQSQLDAMIGAFRTRLNRENLPFILGEMARQWVSSVSASATQTIIKNTPNRVPNTFCVTTENLNGDSGDIIHFNANSLRELGKRYFSGYLQLSVITPSTPSTPTPNPNPTPNPTHSYPTPTIELLFTNDNFNNTGSSGLNYSAVGSAAVTNDATRGKVLKCDVNDGVAYLIPSTGENSYSIPINHTKCAWVKYLGARLSNVVSSQNLAWWINDTYLQAGNVDSGFQLIKDTTAFPIDTWVHVALVQTSTTLTLYKNGQSIGSNNINGESQPFRIGCYLNDADSWKGYLDKVQIWESALSSSQILEIYNEG